MHYIHSQVPGCTGNFLRYIIGVLLIYELKYRPGKSIGDCAKSESVFIKEFFGLWILVKNVFLCNRFFTVNIYSIDSCLSIMNPNPAVSCSSGGNKEKILLSPVQV